MPDMSKMDFEQAMGEEFASGICPPVPFEDASPHECCEVIAVVLGEEVTPDLLSAISSEQVAELAIQFGVYFAVDPPSHEQVRSAIAGTLRRWPVGSL